MTNKEVIMKSQTTDRHAEAIGFASGNFNNASAFVPSHPVRRPAVFACTLLAVALCLGGNVKGQQSSASASQTGQAAAQNVINAEVPVFLAKSIDSKKLKAGEEVDGKTAATLQLSDGTTISRGAKVAGHVIEAKARSNGDAESSLNIVFDKIDLQGGKDLAMTSVIQAVAPNPNAADTTGGGIGYGGMNEMIEKPPTPTFAPKAVPLLNEQSAGVLGIKNLQLASNGVLTSDQKSVKLDSGTQIMVQAQIGGN
jgi:hypothetical protein